MTIQMLGQLERKNRVLLVSQSQLLQYSVSFVWQHHFRIDAACFIFRAYQTLPGFHLSLTIKIQYILYDEFFSHVCQDCAVQTNSGRLAVSEKFSARSKTKGSSHTIGKYIYINLRDRGAPFVPRGPG